MIDEQRQYLSYLLRLWQERVTSPAVWRASLENSQTGERLGFADIMQLFAFLEKQIADEEPALSLKWAQPTNPKGRRAGHPLGDARATPRPLESRREDLANQGEDKPDDH